MITYSLVPFDEIADFVARNAEQHYDDLLEDTGEKHAKINWEYYLNASAIERCKAVVAYDDEQPVGYSWYTINNDPLHRDKWMAYSQALWVHKDYRNKVDIIKEAEIGLKKLGIDEIVYIFGNEKLCRLMKMNGYKQKQIVWSK